MRKTLSALTVSTGALAAGAALADEKTFDFGGFEGVSTSAGIRTIITVGEDFSVRAESAEEGLERLDIRVRNGELDIGRKRRPVSFGRQPEITVYVSAPALSALDASSGAYAEATGVARGPFSLDVSSGAHAIVSGVCTALNVDASSGAHAEAGALRCKTASVDASSGASAEIFASDSVVAEASSGASVEIHGEPANVNIDKSSGGGVRIVK